MLKILEGRLQQYVNREFPELNLQYPLRYFLLLQIMVKTVSFQGKGRGLDFWLENLDLPLSVVWTPQTKTNQPIKKFFFDFSISNQLSLNYHYTKLSYFKS